jgi:hypothetical protein
MKYVSVQFMTNRSESWLLLSVLFLCVIKARFTFLWYMCEDI